MTAAAADNHRAIVALPTSQPPASSKVVKGALQLTSQPPASSKAVKGAKQPKNHRRIRVNHSHNHRKQPVKQPAISRMFRDRTISKPEARRVINRSRAQGVVGVAGADVHLVRTAMQTIPIRQPVAPIYKTNLRLMATSNRQVRVSSTTRRAVPVM